MKNVILIFFISITLSCSFDNKTGIWKDISNIKVDNSSVESIEANTSVTRYEDVFIKNKIFNEEVNVSNNFFSKLEVPIRVENWSEEYGAKTNNISNFYYNGSKNILSKSSKLSRLSLKKNLIF